MSAFLITTSIRGNSKTQLWEGVGPLALGHPFRWVLERSGSGVRLRDLSGDFGEWNRGAIHELSRSQIQAGVEIDFPREFKFGIRPVHQTAPIFEKPPTHEKPGSATELRVYRCLGSWATESYPLPQAEFTGKSFFGRPRKTKYDGRAGGKALFSLKRGQNGSIILETKRKGQQGRLELQEKTGISRELTFGECVELPAGAIEQSTLRFHSQSGAAEIVWRFGLASIPEFADSARRAAWGESPDDEGAWFKRAMQGAGLALLLFCLLSWLWPAPPKETELVPPQFAQILMPKTEKAPARASSEIGAPARIEKPSPKKVQESAVVQAFRAKALSSAVNGLLKGGMTKLLAQSDFLAGATHSREARSILDVKNQDAQATTALSALVGSKNVKVASLGGGAQGGGGQAIGYGRGEHAAVKGQGKGFIPFVQADASGSTVEEGLTRDEVGEVIHRHLSEIRYCYESAMIREADIEGKLMTSFVIGGNGAVKSAEAKSSTLPDPRLDDCILRRLVTWPFPKPRGGVDVAVTYPFIFKTLGR